MPGGGRIPAGGQKLRRGVPGGDDPGVGVEPKEVTTERAESMHFQSIFSAFYFFVGRSDRDFVF
jgi:hypothetical protein